MLSLKKLSNSYPLAISSILLFCLWYVVVFINLDKHYLFIWDEARYALNTYDFLQHKNPFLVSAHGVGDWWNTKPPMLMWLQGISCSVLGYNELGIRFPSAFAALFTGFALLFYSKQYLQTTIPGFIAAIILFSIDNYNGYHITKTGDVDSVLILFTTVYTLQFYQFVLSKNITHKGLLVFSTALIAAFYTKSIAGFIPMLGIAVYTIASKKMHFVFKEKKVYLYGIATITICVLYYIIRDAIDTGYIKKAIFGIELNMYAHKEYESEIGIRLVSFFQEKLSYYSYFLLLTPLLFILKLPKQLYFYLLSVGFIFVLVHAQSATTRNWYDVPALPIFVLAISYLFYACIKHLLLTKNVAAYVYIAIIGIGLSLALYKEYTIVTTKNFSKNSYTCNYIDDAPAAFIHFHYASNSTPKEFTYYAQNNISRDSSFQARYDLAHKNIQNIKSDNVYFYKHKLKGMGVTINIELDFNPIQGDTILLRRDFPHYDSLIANKNIISKNDMMSLLVY